MSLAEYRRVYAGARRCARFSNRSAAAASQPAACFTQHSPIRREQTVAPRRQRIEYTRRRDGTAAIMMSEDYTAPSSFRCLPAAFTMGKYTIATRATAQHSRCYGSTCRQRSAAASRDKTAYGKWHVGRRAGRGRSAIKVHAWQKLRRGAPAKFRRSSSRCAVTAFPPECQTAEISHRAATRYNMRELCR